ncbi:hypothetical protein M8J77_019295 [Diaphorina citri]|nr:hypothetical protein M8J77_019295 [Diaphorina citri]
MGKGEEKEEERESSLQDYEYSKEIQKVLSKLWHSSSCTPEVTYSNEISIQFSFDKIIPTILAYSRCSGSLRNPAATDGHFAAPRRLEDNNLFMIVPTSEQQRRNEVECEMIPESLMKGDTKRIPVAFQIRVKPLPSEEI